MKKLGLLKFNDLYEQQCLMLTHDCFLQRAPKIITNLISRQSSEYNLRQQAQNPFDLKMMDASVWGSLSTVKIHTLSLITGSFSLQVKSAKLG